ncbi:MAG: hypothetical protein IJK39_00945 [Bacteroidales bacterium]|jgi:tetratricopeptide (TPR) repeat protein/outer membrane protein OmpA-like peptidoglycan-associated protein|nr:hypothetical protein [Bacteroidales bacterium]MBR6971663.1 hypothetical protein [Bacteroidales bacterium]
MKRFFKTTLIAAVALIAAFCANPQQMAKLASMVKTECTPQILECVAGQIKATYSISFPANYFLPNAYLKITPQLVYNGTTENGPEFWMQGEKIRDNYAVVPYKSASNVKRDVVFQYKPGMEKAVLQLAVTIYNASKSKSWTYPLPFKIAEGTICTSNLAQTNGIPFFEKDNYQMETTEQVETQILYDVNKSDVKAARLNSDEVKAFEKFLSDANSDSRTTVKKGKIIGYASPEGPEDKNNKLSIERAKSAKAAYDKTISKRANVNMDVTVEERGEDWEGFKKLVEASNIEDKDLIIRVLSMYSDPVVREREIRNMSQVFQTLNNKVLPQLRRSRIVAEVDKKNFNDEELKQMIETSDDRLTEEGLLYSANLFDDPAKKASIYNQAVRRFNSQRAINNLAALALQQNKPDEAMSWLNKVTDKTAGYYNNLGVVEMQKGNADKAAEYFYMAQGENGEVIDSAKENLGALLIQDGDVDGALEILNGTDGFIHGLALVLKGRNDEALKHLKQEYNPDESYLRAIIAARKGDVTTCENELVKAFEKKCYEERIDNDIEFAALQ